MIVFILAILINMDINNNKSYSNPVRYYFPHFVQMKTKAQYFR